MHQQLVVRASPRSPGSGSAAKSNRSPPAAGGRSRGRQPAHGGPRHRRVLISTADQDPMCLGDVPAPVQVNSLDHQRGCVNPCRPEHPTWVSTGLHPCHFLDDLVAVPRQGCVLAGHRRQVAGEADGDKVAERLLRGHVPIQQQCKPWGSEPGSQTVVDLVPIWRLIRPSIATMPRSRRGETASPSPSR